MGERDWRSNIGRRLSIVLGRDRVAVGWTGNDGRRGPHIRRGVIGEFSDRSRARLRSYLWNSESDYRYMGTLTIADDILSANDFKESLNNYFRWKLRAMQRAAGPENEWQESLVWILEFQQRGAPHIHYLYTTPIDWRECAIKWTASIDQPWAFSTSTRFERIRGSRASSVGYALKYATKRDQKLLPAGVEQYGRWWGVRGCRRTVAAALVGELSDSNQARVRSTLDSVLKALKQAENAGNMRRIPWKGGLGVSFFAKTSSISGPAHKMLLGELHRLLLRMAQNEHFELGCELGVLGELDEMTPAEIELIDMDLEGDQWPS